jgi:sialate O-acetylesterase
MKLHFLSAAAALAVAAVGLSSPAARADVKLPLLLSDGCVLQQKAPVRIYGTARPGEKVSVSFLSQARDTTAGPDGAWQVTLAPLSAGGPFTLIVRGDNTVIVRDVLVGEVWVASGQSNMEWSMLNTFDSANEIAKANDPQLRMFTVRKSIARAAQKEVAGGAWQSATPPTAPGFSAVGYYFARALRQARKVPVGIIHTSWGGTRIEAWMGREALLATGTPASEFQPADTNSPAFKQAMAAYQQRLAAWKAAGSPQGPATDPGRVAATTQNWEATGFDDAGWGRIAAPGLWEVAGIEELSALDGSVWLRRVIDVPASLAGREATLSLGAIDDMDTTFVNGVKIGATGAETASSWQAPRRYPIPAGLLKRGRNVIAVRVWDAQGGGGFSGPKNEMYLEEKFPPGIQTLKAPERIDLAGEWRYRVEQGRVSDPGPSPDANNPQMASGLYNAMLAPLTSYAIKGAIWYQGESNAGNAPTYRIQLPAMIQNWRHDFDNKDFPFLVVQLAPFMKINPLPEDTNWAWLRESQQMTTRAIPNVGMAVIVDVGEENDIHPRKKGPVGERLALLARRIGYGEKIVAEGPVYKGMKVSGNRAILTFDSVGGGLVARSVDTAGKSVPDGKLVGFAVAGSDGKFMWADARITGKNTVEVSSPQVPQPVAVRYGWANYPVVNLWNREGLPASPFRTDAPK